MKEFKEFLLKTNALALAVGVILGAAVGKVVSSLVSDLLMPPIGLLVGNLDFSNLFLNLSATHYATLEEARKAGAPTLNYGAFINSIIDFMIIALCIFLLTKIAMKPAPVPPAPPTKECPQCCESIVRAAKKCRFCGSVQV